MTTSTTCRALYVHVPFCRQRCGYCDFYSEVLIPGAAEQYVRAVLVELAGHVRHEPLRCASIYIGGGTPTVLPSACLSALLAGLRAHVRPLDELEFTVEANPATVDPATAELLAAAGVNRVSLGAQSFHADELRTLDRRHAPEDVARTVALCRTAGIGRTSLDLIFGIPGQTLSSWRDSLERALALNPDHISCYGLTYEPGTPLHARVATGAVRRVNEDVEAEMYELALEALPAAGLAHYEISNFARPGCECRHNLTYWENEPSLGIGPAAAGLIGGTRYKNLPDTAAYCAAIRTGRSAWVEQETLSPERRARETAMLALRLTRGIDCAAFERRFGCDPRTLFRDAIQRHGANGLLICDDATIRLTRRGFLLADRVMMDFL